MHLKNLKLENFRNHESLELNFDFEKINVFFGSNGIGKSNILEAIYTIAITKSFRTNLIKELIQYNKGHFRISTKTMIDSVETDFEICYQNVPTKRVLKKNGVSTIFKKYFGNILISFFSPDELNLIYLEPSRRRKYLNTVLSQIYPEYLEALIKYEKVLIQRNRLLNMIKENKASKTDITLWDEKLVLYGDILIKFRTSFLTEIIADINDFYAKISSQDADVFINYKYPKTFEESLKSSLNEDIARGVTTHGPHRDDFEMFLNGHSANHFCSRGECRSIILSLKLAEKIFFQNKLNKNPIILLDDVFSELDKERQMHLLENLNNSQVFITTSMNENELPMSNINAIYLR